MKIPYDLIVFSFVALVSLVSLLKLLRTIRLTLRSTQNANGLMSVVYYMTMSLSVMNFTLLCMFVPRILELRNIDDIYLDNIGKYACVILSAAGNFAFSASTLWYAQIALMLGLLLLGYSIDWFRKNSCKHHMTVWIITYILWLAGFIPYVKSRNILQYCWDSKSFPKSTLDTIFIYYSPAILTMTFSIIVLFMAMYQLKRRKTILDITFFVGCFVIVWFFPIANALVTWLHSEIFWLSFGHNFALCAAGLLHFNVWFSLARRAKDRFLLLGTLKDDIHVRIPAIYSSFLISTLFNAHEQNDSFSENSNTPSSLWATPQTSFQFEKSEAMDIKFENSEIQQSKVQSLASTLRSYIAYTTPESGNVGSQKIVFQTNI